MSAELEPRTTAGSRVAATDDGWRLQLPAGPQGTYRLAQLDDYTHRARGDFPWRPPLTLSLRARASCEDLPGTWGFGLWNDPFSLAFGARGTTRRLPSLPNAAWFFFASPPNYLSLRDDLPAQGPLAATFRSLRLPVALLAAATPVLPLLLWPPTARLMRRLARSAISEDSALLHPAQPATTTGEPPPWRRYRLDWRSERTIFQVDDLTVLDTANAPRDPLGLVIWVDNQFAALDPQGRMAFGTLPGEQEVWIEIAGLEVLIG